MQISNQLPKWGKTLRPIKRNENINKIFKCLLVVQVKLLGFCDICSSPLNKTELLVLRPGWEMMMSQSLGLAAEACVEEE